MIRSVASLARRVAGSQDRLARRFAVLAVLAAAAMLASPMPTRALAPKPPCPIASPTVVAMSGAKAPAPKARRPVLDRIGAYTADIEAPTDLGLPGAPADAAPPHASAASYAHAPDATPASAPHGSPHRPPRAA